MNSSCIYTTELNNYELLSFEKERELLVLAQKGDINARNELIMHNMRLVRSIAGHYVCTNLEMSDLITAGSIGLIPAIDKFDLNTPYKFSTYATLWIKQAIRREIMTQNRAIRIPANIQDEYNKIRNTTELLRTALGHEPSNAQIAKILGKTAKYIEEVITFFIEPISVDNPLNDEEDSTLGDIIADNNIEDPTDAIYSEELHNIILSLLDTLPDKEKQVIILRFGLDGETHRSLEDVGKIMNCSREWVRKIENRALSKMRNPIRSNRLKAFMEN